MRRHRLIRNDDELVAAQPSDHALTPGARTKAVAKILDEPIAGGVAETIVDRLQPVEVEIQDGDGAGLLAGEPVRKVGEQRSPIWQTGQIVVLSEMAKPLFGRNAGLELCEQGCDCLECVYRFRLPLPAAALDEAEDTGGQRPRDQRGGGHQRSAAATAPRDGASETTVFVKAVNHHQIFAAFAQRQGRVLAGEGDNAKRIRIRDVEPRRPLRGQHRGPDVVVAVAQEAVVQIEVLDKLCEDLFAGLGRSCRGRFQQLVGNGSDKDQIAPHSVLRSGHLC